MVRRPLSEGSRRQGWLPIHRPPPRQWGDGSRVPLAGRWGQRRGERREYFFFTANSSKVRGCVCVWELEVGFFSGGGHVTFRWGKVAGLWVKTGTAATVFNLQTGEKKKEGKKRHQCAGVAFQGAIVADVPSSLCSQKRELPTQRSSPLVRKEGEKRHGGARTQAGTQKAEDLLSPGAVLH